MDHVQKGKRLLIAVTAANLSFSFLITAVTSSLQHNSGDIGEAVFTIAQGAFRFLSECLLFFLILKGYRWARMITLFLSAFAGVAALLLFASDPMLLTAAIYLLLFAVYLFSFFVLLSKPVKSYQAYKKGQRDRQG